jgi:uncharacterized coiled-coil protein SlyX
MEQDDSLLNISPQALAMFIGYRQIFEKWREAIAKSDQLELRLTLVEQLIEKMNETLASGKLNEDETKKLEWFKNEAFQLKYEILEKL